MSPQINTFPTVLKYQLKDRKNGCGEVDQTAICQPWLTQPDFDAIPTAVPFTSEYGRQRLRAYTP